MSKRRKAYAGLLAVSLVAASLYFSQPTVTPVPKTTGAYRALQAWTAARDYPYEQSSAHSYYKGWVQGSKYKSAAARYKTGDSWSSIGPINQGGRTLALAYDPDHPEILFAGSASGGLWRSETGGRGEFAWSRVETGFPILGVAAIGINPENGDEIYIGTGEVYGREPTRPGVGDRRTRGSYGMGILKSEDGGQSWRWSLDWRYQDRTGIQDLKFDPLEGSTVWAATTEGVYVTRDAGLSWNKSLDVAMATSLTIDPRDPNIIVAACGGFRSPGHGIYRTTDGGAGWLRIDMGEAANFNGKVLLDRAPSDPGIIYASVGNGSDLSGTEGERLVTWLLRSDNGGATFTLRNNSFDYAGYQGWYSHFVKVDPQDSEKLMIGGIDVSQSSNGGLEINPFFCNNQEGLGIDNHTGIFLPDGTFLVGSDMGVYASFEQLCDARNHGYHVRQFYRGMAQSQQNRDQLYGAPQDSGGMAYQGGREWVWSLGHEGGYTLINPDDDTIRYYGYAHLLGFDRVGLPGFPAEVPVNGDLNRDWFLNTNFNAPLAMAPSQPGTLLAGRTLLYKSTDSAAGWTAVNGGQSLDGNPLYLLAFSHQDAAVVYAATSPTLGPMHVFRSNDGGDSFSDITGNLPDRWPSCMALDPNDHDTVWLTFSGFGSSHLFKSEDGGLSWYDWDGGKLPDVPTNVVFLDPDYPNHLYLGNDLGVLASLDGGNSWFDFSDGLPEAIMVNDLLSYGPERLLRVGTHGAGVYERQLLEPVNGSGAETVLMYPWISNNEGNFSSTLVVNNLSGLSVTATLVARRSNGDTQSVNRVLAPGGMLVEEASSLFPEMGSGGGYSVRLSAPAEGLYGRWVTASLQAESGASPSQGVAVAVPGAGELGDERLGTSLEYAYLPTSPAFVSAPVVVNVGTGDTEVRLTFYDGEGMVVGNHVETLAPNVPLARVVSDFTTGIEGAVRMRATSSGEPITGVSFVFNQVYNETAVANATRTTTEQGSGRLVYPWVSNLEGGYESILVAVNYSESPRMVSLTARREDGASQTVNRAVSPGGFLAEQASSLFPLLGSGAGYTVDLEADTSLVAGQWVTHNLQSASGGSPGQGVAVSHGGSQWASGKVGRSLLLGFLPGGADMLAAPVLVNLGEGPTDITLDFYDGEGHLRLRDRQTLAAREPLRPFARLSGQLIDREGHLYLVATSSGEPITAVTFVFNQAYFEPAIGNAQVIR